MPNNAVPAAATGLPIPHPRLVELIARRALRRKVERAVTVLIAVLDEIDADPEAEPSLGAPERLAGTWGRAVGPADDREDENEHGGDVLNECHDGDTEDDRGWDDDTGIGDADGLAEQVRQWDGRLSHSVGGYVA